MASIKHDPERGVTVLKWTTGGRGGKGTSATFVTRGGADAHRNPEGWAAFDLALRAQGHPAVPAGWERAGRRWRLVVEAEVEAGRLTAYGRTYIADVMGGTDDYRAECRRAFDMHVVPHLGDMWLDEITAGDVLRWQRAAGRKHAGKTVLGWRSILGQIMRAAVLDNLAAHDPVSAVKPPKGGRKYQSKAIAAGDLGAYVAAMRTVTLPAYGKGTDTGEPDATFSDLAEVLLLTGARYSEVAGKRERDYLPASKSKPARLDISKAKSEAGVREVDLGARAVAIIESRLTGNPDGLIFESRRGGVYPPTTFRRRWEAMLNAAREAGVDVPAGRITGREVKRNAVTPHGLRRTHISHRIRLGHDPATVAKSVGHKHATTTYDVYTEAVGDEGEAGRQADEFDALVESAGRRLKVAR